ncbi:hypothetical protein [Streptomyces sp. NPDC012466]|jgi:hypothetical protein
MPEVPAHADVTWAYKGLGGMPDWVSVAIIVLVCVWMIVAAKRRDRS